MRENYLLPSYSYGGHEIYKEVPRFTAPYGKKVVIIGGATALSKAMPYLRPTLETAGITIVDEILFGGECSFAARDRLCAMPTVQEAEFLFAIGGGKAIDTVKIVAVALGDKPFFTFPTVAATCAANSEVAAVYTTEHVFETAAFVHHPPLHCFIDGQILVEAPERFLWAGMGDTIAKRYETTFSARNGDRTYNSQLGLTLAPMCSEPVLEQGIAAMEANKKQVRSRAFDEMAMAVIFTTALVSGALREEYNSSLAHAVCYGCTTNQETERFHLHGELVSYGVLVLFIKN